MQTEWIDLGTEVYSHDGETKLGTVDRLVLNSENQHLEQLVVNQGILSRDKLIDLDLVDRMQPDRIVLSVSADEAEQLPDFVETQFVAVPADDLTRRADLQPAALGAGRIFYGGPLIGAGYPGAVPPAAPSPTAAPPVVQNISNLPEPDVMIDRGTDVIGAEGAKVGIVDQVLFDEGGPLRGFIVKTGFLFKRDVTIPIDWVAEVGSQSIHLNVTAKEAKQRPQP